MNTVIGVGLMVYAVAVGYVRTVMGRWSSMREERWTYVYPALVVVIGWVTAYIVFH
jgi:hypothetical protein